MSCFITHFLSLIALKSKFYKIDYQHLYQALHESHSIQVMMRIIIVKVMETDHFPCDLN